MILIIIGPLSVCIVLVLILAGWVTEYMNVVHAIATRLYYNIIMSI